MKASKFAELIKSQIDLYGDHDIIGGYVHDDTEPENFIPLDKNGCETNRAEETVGYYIS